MLSPSQPRGRRTCRCRNEQNGPSATFSLHRSLSSCRRNSSWVSGFHGRPSGSCTQWRLCTLRREDELVALCNSQSCWRTGIDIYWQTGDIPPVALIVSLITGGHIVRRSFDMMSKVQHVLLDPSKLTQPTDINAFCMWGLFQWDSGKGAANGIRQLDRPTKSAFCGQRSNELGSEASLFVLAMQWGMLRWDCSMRSFSLIQITFSHLKSEPIENTFQHCGVVWWWGTVFLSHQAVSSFRTTCVCPLTRTSQAQVLWSTN